MAHHGHSSLGFPPGCLWALPCSGSLPQGLSLSGVASLEYFPFRDLTHCTDYWILDSQRQEEQDLPGPGEGN